MANYLFAVASSCQMYSGTGTAIFDWMSFASDRFRFSVIMDTEHPQNVEVTARFCERNNVPFMTSQSFFLPGCPDSGIKDVGRVLRTGSYDVVECVSWANAATNMQVLCSLPSTTKLVFTPHTQPTWTLGEPTRFPCVPQVFRSMLNRSDAVFVDSAAETRLPLFLGARSLANVHNVPLGVDIARFRPAGRRQSKTILCVCDCREGRKRVDLLLAAFSRASIADPELRLILAGKGSDSVPLPVDCADRITRLGYISADQLVELYQTSTCFALMSDYEAFGLPIAEALCCGTPAILNTQDAVIDLFAGLPGTQFERNTDIEAVARAMLSFASSPNDHAHIAKTAQKRFSFQNTYGQKLRVINSLLAERAMLLAAE